MSTVTNILSIDVEDYYNVSNLRDVLPEREWGHCPSQVVKYTGKLLEILDWTNTKATFFILGWIARHNPDLVRQIHRRGHEVACHSYAHRLVYEMTPEEFREDTRMAKEILEDLTGQPVLGYRAPSFSIVERSRWAYPILMDLGFTYSSSTHPVRHDLYGNPNAPTHPHLVAHKDRTLVEIPVSTLRILGQNVPFSGGGYLRLLPYPLLAAAIRRFNERRAEPVVVYIHPWEINPEQPRYRISLARKFRQYVNLATTDQKFWNLVHNFPFQPAQAFLGEWPGLWTQPLGEHTMVLA